MTRPETCSEAGGAISLWVKVVKCAGSGGIISSKAFDKTGITITCIKRKPTYDAHISYKLESVMNQVFHDSTVIAFDVFF